MKTKKKINGVVGIKKREEMKNLYEEIFSAVDHAIGLNLYSIHASLGDVVILKGATEITRLDYEDFSYEEMIREIKKQLIKNGLYVYEIKTEPNTLVLKTTNDLLSLLYVPECDDANDNYYSQELAEIKAEIEEEQQEPLQYRKPTSEEKAEMDAALVAFNKEMELVHAGKTDLTRMEELRKKHRDLVAEYCTTDEQKASGDIPF